jgi:hypothetical protein
LFFNTILGCSVFVKKEQQVMALQSQRIKLLEKELKKKNSYIKKHKVMNWVSPENTQDDHSEVVRAMDSKNWTRALSLATQKLQLNPSDMGLRKLRLRMFEQMGLFKQAENEQLLIKKFTAKKNTEHKTI